MRHTISLFCLLSLFWLANSGPDHFSILLLSIGFFSIVFVLLISHKMDLIDHESQPLHLTHRMPAYFWWLTKEIIISNYDVVRCVWSIKSTISPTLFTLLVNQKTDMGKVIYANSITLTPGTVTININENEFTVHALTVKSALALKSGAMDQRVCLLEN